MDINQIKTSLGADWDRTLSYIREALRSDVSLLNMVNESILSRNGKMMRPVLAILSARVCAGRTNDDTCRLAAVMELLHNATLLHDDVADQSVERRGMPTVSSIYGGPASVLLGDFWLVRCIRLVLDVEHSSRIIGVVSKTLSDLAEGELLQLEKSSSGDTTEEDYLRIIYSKTASLFEAACLSGAVTVGASEQAEKAIRDYGVNLGLAFQIKDDIMDYDETMSIGKPVGVDLKEQKITLPLLGLIRRLSPEMQASVRKDVTRISQDPSICDHLHRMVVESDGIDYAKERLDLYVNKAKQALDIFPQSQSKEFLLQLADYTACRKI